MAMMSNKTPAVIPPTAAVTGGVTWVPLGEVELLDVEAVRESPLATKTKNAKMSAESMNRDVLLRNM